MTKSIPLTQGKFTLVDDDVFEFLNQWNWYAHLDRGTWYAQRDNGTTIKMHRVIMDAPEGTKVDHRDGNGLYNVRSNLRVCTHAENGYNRKLGNNSTSGYKGVSVDGNKWMAQLRKGGERVFCKTFRTPEEAARAYDEAAKKHFGEFARTNF